MFRDWAGILGGGGVRECEKGNRGEGSGVYRGQGITCR